METFTQKLTHVYLHVHTYTHIMKEMCPRAKSQRGVGCKDLEVQFWSRALRAIPSTLHQYEREPVRQGRLHQNKTHYRQAPAIYGPANVIFLFMAEILMFLSWYTLKENSSFQALSCQDRGGREKESGMGGWG